jgi:hypothetical protein
MTLATLTKNGLTAETAETVEKKLEYSQRSPRALR